MQNHYPDFIYIGPPKTGTTFLRSYFSFHPEIYWIRKAQAFCLGTTAQQQYLKDTNTLATEKCYIDVFEALATGIKIVRGEELTKIQFNPQAKVEREIAYYNLEEVLDDIKRNLPNTRIIFSMRNQVDWLGSNYAHFISRLPRGQRSFGEFLRTFEGMGLLEAGHFDKTISLLHKIFGPQNTYIYILEMMARNQEESLQHLCDFLKINYLSFPEEQVRKNQGRSPLMVSLLRVIPDEMRQLVSTRFGRFGKKNWITRILRYSAAQKLLTEKEKESLNARYRTSNALSQELLGISLSDLGYPV